MPIRTATNSSGRPMKVGALIILGAALVLSSMPARAATCEDVRSLSSTEQNYWSKVLHLSSSSDSAYGLPATGTIMPIGKRHL